MQLSKSGAMVPDREVCRPSLKPVNVANLASDQEALKGLNSSNDSLLDMKFAAILIRDLP